MGVSDWEIADIRAEMADYRPESARILRRVSDTTNVEGETWTYVADPATVSASLATSGLTQSEQVIAAKITEATTWVITLPWNVSVSISDRLQFETIDGEAIDPFRLFDVQYASDETHEWNQRVLAIEIETDEDE